MLSALLALTLAAGDARQVARPLAPKDAGVGRLVPDAAFTDLAGRPGRLSDYKSSKLLVVAVTDVGCPVCKKYAPTLAAIEAEFAGKGVAFLFVNPTPTDARADIDAMLAAHKLKGRYVHDTKHSLAAALGVRSTADVFVLDAARTVAYRGAVDDQYGVGYALDAPKHPYLKTALTQLLAGRTPDVSGTTAPGCEVEATPTTVPVTYHNRVSRIVQQNCQECHRAGGAGPFALDGYEHVVARKGTIRRVIDNGTMPPWFAAAPKGGTHSPFLNDRSLSAADRADLLAWLNADMPKGDPADAPLPVAWPDEWRVGTPDAVFEFPKPVKVKAEAPCRTKW